MEAHLIAFFQLSALEKYFAKGGHIDFSSFSTKTPNLKSQTNG
jgi:hypothetical protein